MKTYSPKPADISRTWYIVDASTAPLGRLATTIATMLTGKHKPTYAPHLDSGDYIVVINAADVQVTGNKLTDKVYYRHSGYPGGIKSRTLNEQQIKDSTEVIRKAVRGMLPKNKLLDERLKRLKVYAGSEHPHDPQQPKVLEITHG